jgi:hypothetical protein
MNKEKHEEDIDSSYCYTVDFSCRIGTERSKSERASGQFRR